MEKKNSFTGYLITLGAGILIGILITALISSSREKKIIKNLTHVISEQDSVLKVAAIAMKAATRVADSMDTELWAVREENEILKELSKRSSDRLKSSADSAKRYATLYAAAKLDLDTARMLNTCDELYTEHNTLIERIKEHIVYDDSLSLSWQKERLQSIQLTDTLKAQNSRLSTAYNACLTSKQAVLYDLQIARQRPKQTFWSRARDFIIGAGAGYVLRTATAK